MKNNAQNRHMNAPFMIRKIAVFCLAFMLAFAFNIQAQASQVRIKDIVDFEGVRDNVLVGYGLVVGLNGTGDNLTNAPFTQQSLVAMLERLGVSVRDQNLKTNTVAAVMVTASLPPFAKQGARVDVSVSALGDAESLQGGTLIVTPLLGADGEVYAVAQGPIVSSGFTAGGAADSVTQNIPTQGRISGGALVEREINFSLDELQNVNLTLRNPDFTTARRIEQAINTHFKLPVAKAVSPTSVVMVRTPEMKGSVFDAITDVEQLRITPDQIARVVIDERSGVIVMGQEVRISTVAVAQGNLTIRVTENQAVSQPQPFSQGGQTQVVDRTEVGVDKADGNNLAVLPAGVTLQELVEALNALGVGPRDMISILQSIKAAGALQAEIQVI